MSVDRDSARPPVIQPFPLQWFTHSLFEISGSCSQLVKPLLVLVSVSIVQVKLQSESLPPRKGRDKRN
jgi:hypothetical protein